MGVFGSVMNLALSWFSKSSEQVLQSSAPIMLPSLASGLYQPLQIDVQMGRPLGVFSLQPPELFQQLYLASELHLCVLN